jgi:hypothetical protein
LVTFMLARGMKPNKMKIGIVLGYKSRALGGLGYAYKLNGYPSDCEPT